VFGYFIEVSKSQIDKVPAHYIRKQTTANAERYITAELKDQEAQVLGAEEKAVTLESDLFNRIRLRVAEQAAALIQTARAIAEIDVLANFAEVASLSQWSRPVISEENVLKFESGRHPVVESNVSNFVPNDLEIGIVAPRCLVITGPNMAGKSTYLRQTAIVVLLAQIGSFVPAKHVEIGICDRIFARIGAKDELAHGQSTFMVEMVESANILNHATEHSLVILDEVGRGTSTFDGLAIAWAMTEHLVKVGAKTLFATHYHQLNTLEASNPTIKNFRVSVEEYGDESIWTHLVLPGGADRSYGIHVARMAGVPHSVLGRAQEILSDLEQESPPAPVTAVRSERLQMTLFELETPEVVRELSRVDVNALTPIEALRLLDEWKRKFGG
jgi:DNA mismatch repair protein MutS